MIQEVFTNGLEGAKASAGAFANLIRSVPEPLQIITSAIGLLLIANKIYSFLSLLFSVYVSIGRKV